VPKMAALRHLVEHTLDQGQPLLAVCLGHQILCDVLGLELVAKDTPLQGTQREIELFGRVERAGFYCTFTARVRGNRAEAGARAPRFPRTTAPDDVEVCADPVSGEVHAVRGDGFAGIQFHAESILTTDGIGILRRLLADLLRFECDR
jgi:2-amino-4-deoxychorismate synthase